MDKYMGKKFGKWSLIEFVGLDKKSNRLYKARCDCGTEKIHSIYTLTLNRSTQCRSCFKPHNEIEVDSKFGKWTVIKRVANNSKKDAKYLCRCECGNEKEVIAYRLRGLGSKSCPKCRVKTHGMSQTSTFRIWQGMLRRCNNPKFKNYMYYGGRGIKICERWLKFENFLADMGERPLKLQIDRINNDGDYEPNNCRWVTAKENNMNRNIIKREK